MSKVNQIQIKIKELNGGQFQSLCDSYLSRRYGVSITSTGSQDGTDKTVKGTPDSYFLESDEQYVFIEYTTQETNICKKIKSDIKKCFDPEISGIPAESIRKIIYCHTKKINSREHLEITSMCKEKGCLFENFDTGGLSRELAYAYPEVAKQELGIDIDTDQIIDSERFIQIESETISLENQFFYRENEKENLIKSIIESDVVVLTGGAGVGKTRLALECLPDFSNKYPDYSIYCIKNRSLSLFDDFVVRKSASDKLLFLVDDANRIGNLSTILSYINENSTEIRIKLILTVRNYALDLILRQLNLALVKYSQIEIDAFEPNEIETIISSESFNIKNSYVISRICTVSQGNVRLAVMAAEVIQKTENLEDLKDVSSIYDNYFSEIKSTVFTDGNDIAEKVLTLVSYFYSISKNNPPEGIYDNFGITESDFWDYVYKLNEHELIDLHEDSTCKIADQVLGTYIMYKTMFVKKTLDFKLLLNNYFQLNIERMKETIYPIVNSFDGESIIEFIKPAVEEISDHYSETREVESQINLTDVFYFVIPDKVLFFISQYIDSLPSDSDKSEFDTNYHGLTDKVLTIIKRVGDYGEDFLKISIQLAVKYVLRCNSRAHQFGQYIVSGYDFDRAFINESIYRQKILFETLIQSSKKHPLIKESLVYAVPHFLQIQHSNSRNHGMKVTFTNFGLILTEELKALRLLLLQFLETLDCIEFMTCLEKYIEKVRIHYDIPEDELIKALTYDSDYLLPMIESKVSYSSLYDSSIVEKYLKQLQENGISNDLIEIHQEKLNTPNFQLFSVLSSDRLERLEMKNEGLTNEEITRIQELEQRDAVNAFSSAQFGSFISYLYEERQRSGSNGHWEINNAISSLFNSIYNEEHLFISMLLIMINDFGDMAKNLHFIPGIFFRYYPNDHLKLYQLLADKSDFKGQSQLKYYFFTSLPDDLINDFYIVELKSLFENDILGIDIYFDSLLKYEAAQQGLLLELIRLLYVNREKNNVRFSYLFNPYSEITKDFMDIIFHDEELIQDIWLYEMGRKADIDYSGLYFIRFLNASPHFIKKYLDLIYQQQEQNHISDFTRHPDFTKIWMLPNYSELICSVVDYIHKHERYISYHTFLNTFFTIKDSNQEITDEVRDKQKSFLKDYIDSHHNDLELMNLIFIPIKRSFRNDMSNYALQLLKLENSEDVFESISFDPGNYSSRGSFVPDYEKAMAFWVELKEKLVEPELIISRVYVASQIDMWKRRIRLEHERNFARKF